MKKIPCETYCRIVGYFRPLGNWKKGKIEEYYERKMFSQDVFTSSSSGADNNC